MNTVLVNISKENKPWGFWYMKDEKAKEVEFLASHDNKTIVNIYKIIKRFKVDLLEEYPAKPDRKAKQKWCFHIEEISVADFTKAKDKLKDVKLKGLQGVTYADISEKYILDVTVDEYACVSYYDKYEFDTLSELKEFVEEVREDVRYDEDVKDVTLDQDSEYYYELYISGYDEDDFDEDGGGSDWGLNEDGRGTYLSDGVWATNPPW